MKGKTPRMKNKIVFDPSCMRKRYPHPPRGICTSWFDWLIGRASPSKFMIAQVYGDDKALKWDTEVLKYLCYKRRLTRDMWRKLYNRIKGERGGSNAS